MAYASQGPVSTLPGHYLNVPEGTMCDNHPDRIAIRRVQGETDSFGCEAEDMCQECFDAEIASRYEPCPACHGNRGEFPDLYTCPVCMNEGKIRRRNMGNCDWCKSTNVEVRPHRDFEEGRAGRVYDVCNECIRKENERLTAELDSDDDGPWDDHYESDRDREEDAEEIRR